MKALSLSLSIYIYIFVEFAIIISLLTPKTTAKFAGQTLDTLISCLASVINTFFSVSDHFTICDIRPFLGFSSSGEISEKYQHVGQARFIKNNFNK